MGTDVARLKRTRGTRLLSLALGGALVAAGLTAAPAAFAAPGADCQPFSSTPCLLPFPDDLYTVKDNSTPTGVRVHMPQAAMPANGSNAKIGVAEYNRNDGFSPGSDIVVRVPGLDNPAAMAKTKPAPLTDLSQARKPSAPIVVIDAATNKRRVVWAELDSNASDAAHTTLLIHAAKNFTEGHRYIVAMRNLENKNGATLQAPSWFAKLRDNKPLPAAEQSQKARYDSIFKSLDKAGIARNSLYEAWDFTVMSRQSLTSRMLQIRNSAFSKLGDNNLADGQVQGIAPPFTVGSVTNNPDTGIAREVTGTFSVPCYLNDSGCTPTPNGSTDGGGFHYSSNAPDAVPTRIPGNTATAQFDCIIPTSASANSPARPSLYGHGLLGSADEVDAGNVEAMASEHDMMFCATDWWGLASGDVPFDIGALQDLNKFPDVVDRLQQGVLNTLYLGRLMRTSDGFASDPAFQNGGSQPLFGTANLYYDGNSQGGIMGGMTTAVAPDYTRAVLGVPGMDYGGLLLQRSTDFGAYAAFLFGPSGYSDESLHPLILDLMQQLWDRGEADGYAQHMTYSALPDTPQHKVLMQGAYGDHQVSMYAAAVEARTIGAKYHSPALDLPARAQDQNMFYGVTPIQSYPFRGSAYVIWDNGPGLTEDPPTTNTPPPEGGPHQDDPHGDVRATVAARTQKSNFLRPNNLSKVIDVCGGQPCHTDIYTP
ncbi:MAG: hypothetical protein ACRDMH_18190 [Solirubrobacterales bacterium]